MLGGAGLTGIAVTVLEKYWEKKERVIQYFREMVFTADVFNVLKARYEAYDLLLWFEIARKNNWPELTIRGQRTKITNSLQDMKVMKALLQIGKEQYDSVQKAMTSGAWFLLPTNLKDILGKNPSPPEILLESNPKKRAEMIFECGGSIDKASDIIKKTLGLST